VSQQHYTFFMRGPEQLAALAGPLLDEFLARGPQVRVWSAACSTGEEPYSLAIALLESGKLAEGQFAVRATDVAPGAVERARGGVYARTAFRMTDPAIRETWFHPCEGGFEVDERLRRAISFGCVDLLDAAAVAAEGPFDAIFCCNVLEIVLTEPQRRAVVASLASALRPGGYLIVGREETAVVAERPDLYEPVPIGTATAYRLRAEVPA
jgi:chemotaxis methyl-accepting protein methylase